jgi:crotonobetainyl-CoA:carnitine CoA-transferase CaiB-like acyl-CoA transferase
MDHPINGIVPVDPPLAGVRVVDTTSYMTGPYAATMLADLGAEVIKVEPPGGDGFRGFGHKVQGWSALWSQCNRGKRSIELDLKAPADLGVLKQLLQAADVLVENWRPHVAGKLGLSQDVVGAVNPKLVRLSITGFGDSGPLSAAPAYDSLIQGHTGMAQLHGKLGQPEVAAYWVVDKVVATFAAQAVLAALFRRERTGRGGQVALPMLDVMAYFNFPDMFQHRAFVADTTPWRPAFNPVVKTADGHLILTPVNGGQLSRTLKAIGASHLKEQMLAHDDHGAMIDFFYREVGRIVATQPTAHWLPIFETFDVPAAPVRSLDEHLADEQVVHNRIYVDVPTPAGAMRVPRHPARFDGQLLRPAGAAPSIGQHSDEIRASLAQAECA